MHESSHERIPQQPPTGTEHRARSAAGLTSEVRRKIFKAMVVAELEAGFLRYSRRAALLRYASGLGIPEFEACLLIAEAQYNADDIEPLAFIPPGTLIATPRHESWSVSVRLAAIGGVAILIDALLLYWLFG